MKALPLPHEWDQPRLVTVTADAINGGRPLYGHDCAIARALAPLFAEPLTVFNRYLTIRHGDQTRMLFITSDALIARVRFIDLGGRMQPFILRVDPPGQVDLFPTPPDTWPDLEWVIPVTHESFMHSNEEVTQPLDDERLYSQRALRHALRQAWFFLDPDRVSVAPCTVEAYLPGQEGCDRYWGMMHRARARAIEVPFDPYLMLAHPTPHKLSADGEGPS